MGALYLTWLADELRAAGLTVVEYDGWQTRGRSTGGFDAPPLAVFWHHTASNGDAQADCDYMVHSSDNRPTCNLYIARDGAVWVLAAGATNTNGKGQALAFSRGTVPADGANTRVVGIEGGNDGIGMDWPQAQIDAYLTASNVVNRRLGNRPDDIATHNGYAPDRKIDPATAAAVAGPWRPGSSTSSGTWSTPDIAAECTARADGTDPNGDDVTDDDIARIAAAVWGHPFRDASAQTYLTNVLDLCSQIGTLCTDGAAVWNRDMRSQLGGPAPAQVFVENIYDLCSQIGTIVTDLQRQAGP